MHVRVNNNNNSNNKTVIKNFLILRKMIIIMMITKVYSFHSLQWLFYRIFINNILESFVHLAWIDPEIHF